MDSDSIQRWQAAKIHQALRPTVGYLYRLRERMQQVGFLPGDPLFERVCRAHEALQALFVEVHYLSSDGAWRPPRK